MCDDSCVLNLNAGASARRIGPIQCEAYAGMGMGSKMGSSKMSSSMKKDDIHLTPDMTDMAIKDFDDLQALEAFRAVDEPIYKVREVVEVNDAASKVFSAVSLQEYTGIDGDCECGAGEDAQEIMDALEQPGEMIVFDPEEDLNDVMAPRNNDLIFRETAVYRALLGDLVRMEKIEKGNYDEMLETFQTDRRVKLQEEKDDF